MDRDTRIKKIDNTKLLLKVEMERIVELLETDSEDLWDANYKTFQLKSELKAKMHEARRDMIRLEKLLYDYDCDVK